MKIGVISPLNFPCSKGSESVVEGMVAEFVDALSKDKDFEVVLFATGDSDVPSNVELVKVREEAFHTYGHAECTGYLQKLIEEVNSLNYWLDVIHSAVPLWVSHRFKWCPVYKAMYGTVGVEGDIKQTMRRLADAGKLSGIIPVSEYAKRETPLTNYTEVVYNGLDFDRVGTLLPHEDYWLYMGKIHPDKHIEDAVRLSKEFGKKLVVAGDYTGYEDYFHKVLEKDIEYVGVLHEDKWEVYKKAELFVNLTGYPETFSMSNLEALACGTPVLCNGIGANPEIVRNGVTGYLINKNTNICRLAEKAIALDRVECRKSVEERFTVENMVQGYKNIYKREIG